MRFMPLAFMICAAQLLAPVTAAAQAPHLLSYQGRLLKLDGTPEVGPVSIHFALFKSAIGGSAVWAEDQSVGLTDGFFAAYLGSSSAPGVLAAAIDGSDLWLELSVGGEPMTPRQRLASAPYALTCSSVQNLKGGTVDAASIAVKGVPVIDSTGKWVGAATGPVGPPGVPCAGCVDTGSVKDGAITGSKVALGAIAKANIAAGSLTVAPAMTVRIQTVKIAVSPQVKAKVTATCNGDETFIGGTCDNYWGFPNLQNAGEQPSDQNGATNRALTSLTCYFYNGSASTAYDGFANALCAKLNALSVP